MRPLAGPDEGLGPGVQLHCDAMKMRQYDGVHFVGEDNAHSLVGYS